MDPSFSASPIAHQIKSLYSIQRIDQQIKMTTEKIFYTVKFDDEFGSKEAAISFIKDVLASRDSQRENKYELAEFYNTKEIEVAAEVIAIKLSEWIFFIAHHQGKHLLYSTGAELSFSDAEIAMENLEEFQEMVPGIWKIIEMPIT